MRVSMFLRTILTLIALTTSLTSCGRRLEPAPVAKIEPKVDTMFSIEMVDNYAWLRDDSRTDPEVLDYLKAENEYTAKVMQHTQQLQSDIYDEMLGRIKETDLSVPVKHGDYYYYDRTEEGKQYDIYCRKKGSLEADEEILIDVNELAVGHDFMSLGTYLVSPNHRLLAYSTDTAGNERYTLRVKNLETGEHFPDMIPNISGSVEWAADNSTLFYTVPDDAWRPFKLFRHQLGQDNSEDELVFHETDEGFWMNIAKSKDEKYLLLELGSETSSEVWYLDSGNPTGQFQVISARRPKLEYSAWHHDTKFYIVTNDEAKNFKLVTAPEEDPSRDNWTDLIEHNPAVKLDYLSMFKDFMAISEREGGFKQLRVLDFKTQETHRLEFDEPIYRCGIGDNPEFNSPTLRYNYQSLVTPSSVFDYDMGSREAELMKQKEVLGGYDPDQYASERQYATAQDGAKIPVSMVYRKGMKRDGSHPLYLYGYGSYGYSMDPRFSSKRLSLLDRGFIFAIAHIRGGGEMGRSWYEDGKLMNKKNTFTDFIAVGNHLVKENYTSHEKMAITGGSAGGLLIGAVVNMAPTLCKVAVADVPFVDVMNTMLDASIPLTVIEYEEWGDPNQEEAFRYMMSYSPYDNVIAQGYPNMLITGGLYDTRVQYFEPTKWAAKLRATKTDNNRLLLKINMGAGHGGSSGRYDYLKEIALEYAFILDVLGVE
ncbi:MAG: S9 family peptidase [candidate division Zixibacteria bacterium]|nr:S9 family peptidase [candidate division Zixibacteria bacterium]MDH3937658.1 S9 family peptidase [candidate division Zixibacteria bacterium]MDH4034216.1 S9 family peptidase [candidate division Zixibacteria bacterium]